VKTNYTNLQILQPLAQLVGELNATNSKTEKVFILKRYPQCQKLLRWVYDPLIMFHVTSDVVRAQGEDLSAGNCHDTIYSLLEALTKRVVTGQAALNAVRTFVADCPEYDDLIYTIVDKNLECRIDVSSVNKAFPDLIPTFDVALAHKYADHAHKVDFRTQKWYASHKLDGCRAICVVRDGAASFWSRTGHEFESLKTLRTEVEIVAKELKLSNFVLDGEVCIMQDGKEDFKSIVSQVKRKNYDVTNAHYMLFDIVGLEAFEKKESKALLSKRLPLLQKFAGRSKRISVLEQVPVIDESHFTELVALASRMGWEGLILRKDAPYEGKRTSNMLKVKQFHDAEYKVVRVECGPFRIIDKGTRLEKTIETVTNVIINHKGSEVSVGSGFDLAERQHYFAHKDELLGATITVQYFEETTDAKGAVRLRFPTVKHVYGKKGRAV
jgi:DNA ligase-1